MRPGLFRTKDFWAGLFLMGFGAGAVAIARGYPLGSSTRMGAGYFPVTLGMVLVVFGVILTARARADSERVEGGWSPRAFVVVPLALAAFAFLLERVGFAPALVALLIGSAAAGREFRWPEVLVMTAVLTVASVALFVWGLGLPWRVITLPP